jgi:hypothetical protein
MLWVYCETFSKASISAVNPNTYPYSTAKFKMSQMSLLWDNKKSPLDKSQYEDAEDLSRRRVDDIFELPQSDFTGM